MKTYALEGHTILVTRAAHQAAPLSNKLAALGADVVQMPLIEIGPPESFDELDKSLKALESYQWIVFASTNAATHVIERMNHLQIRPDQRKTRIAAIGSATAEVLKQADLTTHFRPQEFIAEAFVETFPGYPKLQGVKILWPRTNIGRQLIFDKLQAAGAEVDVVPCYRSALPAASEAVGEALYDLIANKTISIITLASAQTARNCAQLIKQAMSTRLGKEADGQSLNAFLKDVRIAVIGPETAAAAESLLGRADIQAQEFTMDGLVKAIAEYVEAEPVKP
jgi:uroporphyrinogen-III synthase